MKAKIIWTCAFLVVIALGVGCSHKPEDAKITSEIQNRYSQDSGLSTKQIQVQSAGGVVTLNGNVDNAAQRDAASRQAASVTGVKTVVNNLVVGTSAPVVAASNAPAPQNPVPASPVATADKGKPSAGKSVHKSAATKNASPAEKAEQENSTPSQTPAETAAGPPPVNDEPASPPAPKKYIIDEGTRITVRLIDPIDSEKNQTGDTFHATLNTPLTSDGEQAVPAGVELTGHLIEVKSAGKFAGQSVVAMQLDSLSSGGHTYNLQTDEYRKEGSSTGKKTTEKVVGGAVVGTIIGALAGGGKGAGIGAAAGAGVGSGVQAASKSQQIKLPSETVLNFTLQQPITVVQAPSPDANRQKLGDSQ
jgi:BON domain-containing protein